MTIDLSAPEIRAALAFADASLESIQRDANFPGLSAGIVYDQALIWHKGYGYANLEQKIPADEHSIYRVASITKLFTATMLMQLRDAGKLNLDDPIEKYVPEFKIRSPFPDARPPTFRMVAAHAAGLPREGAHDGWESMKMPTAAQLLEVLAKDEMRFPTMKGLKYSNIGIAVMGHALSKIAGMPYDEYVVKHILEPLGMSASGFDRARYDDTHYAVGYHPDNGTMKPSPFAEEQGFRPAGGLYSSVADIARFLSLQFREGAAGGDQILGSSAIREMHMPVAVTPDFEDGFGIGWWVRRNSGHKISGHSGGLPGYSTNITLVQSLKLAVIVFANTDADPFGISSRLLELLIPVFKRQAERQEVPATAEEQAGWARHVGRYQSVSMNDFLNIEILNGRLMVTSPGADPSSFFQLAPLGKNQFRMVGGLYRGDDVLFQEDAEGNVTGLTFSGYPMKRIS